MKPPLKLPPYPCPVRVTTESGERIYCDGDVGHWSTHCGGKTEAEYHRERREVQNARRKIREEHRA